MKKMDDIKTYGDVIRQMTNEELAEMLLYCKLYAINAAYKKLNVEFDVEQHKNEAYREILARLNANVKESTENA